MSLRLTACILLVTCALCGNGRADENTAPASFANRWERGRKWMYSLEMSGLLDIRHPANSKSPVAGMEFKDVDFKIKNHLTFDVLEADNKEEEPAVALRTEIVELRAATDFGAVVLENGELGLMVNGELRGDPVKIPADAFKYPRQAVRLNSRGQCVGIKFLQPPARARLDLPIDVQAFTQIVDARLLPALWPEKPVSPGDKWESIVTLPLPNVDVADKTVGKLQWTYTGAGQDPKNKERTLQQVNVEGQLEITQKQSALMLEVLADKDAKPQETTHQVSGSVWFDPQIGQVRYARLKVKLNNTHRETGNYNGQAVNNDSWMIFEGDLFLSLMG